MIKLGTPTLNTIVEHETEEDDDSDLDPYSDTFVAFFYELYANISYFCC
jgi:hypothetical protein